MAIKYWEFEDAPFKEKLKNPNVKTVSSIFFDNETESYRFAVLLSEVKKKGQLKLKDVPALIPVATAKRYLDYAVQLGLLKHEDNSYMFTDRFSKPMRNMAAYIKAWIDSPVEEDLSIAFANVRFDKQPKRGGRKQHSKDQNQAVQATDPLQRDNAQS